MNANLHSHYQSPSFTYYDAAGRGLGLGGDHLNTMKGHKPLFIDRIYCEVCKMSSTGPESYKDHLDGRKHKKKEIIMKYAAVPVVEGTPVGLRCELCDVVCTGSDAYAAHIRGAKHQKVLNLLTSLGKPIPSNHPTVVALPTTPIIAAKTTSVSQPELGNNTTAANAASNNVSPAIGKLVKPAAALKTNKSPVLDCRRRDKKIQIVGQNYIEEIRTDDGKGIFFNCKLCDCKFTDPYSKEMHLKGRRHQLQYKKKVNPELVVDERPSKLRQNERKRLGRLPSSASSSTLSTLLEMPPKGHGQPLPEINMVKPMEQITRTPQVISQEVKKRPYSDVNASPYQSGSMAPPVLHPSLLAATELVRGLGLNQVQLEQYAKNVFAARFPMKPEQKYNPNNPSPGFLQQNMTTPQPVVNVYPNFPPPLQSNYTLTMPTNNNNNRFQLQQKKLRQMPPNQQQLLDKNQVLMPKITKIREEPLCFANTRNRHPADVMCPPLPNLNRNIARNIRTKNLQRPPFPILEISSSQPLVQQSAAKHTDTEPLLASNQILAKLRPGMKSPRSKTALNKTLAQQSSSSSNNDKSQTMSSSLNLEAVRKRVSSSSKIADKAPPIQKKTKLDAIKHEELTMGTLHKKSKLKLKLTDEVDIGHTKNTKIHLEDAVKTKTKSKVKKKLRSPNDDENIKMAYNVKDAGAIIGTHDIVVNSCLCKIKMESDFTEPETIVKLEPMELYDGEFPMNFDPPDNVEVDDENKEAEEKDTLDETSNRLESSVQVDLDIRVDQSIFESDEF